MPTLGPLVTAATAISGLALVIGAGPAQAADGVCAPSPALGAAAPYVEVVEGASRRLGTVAGALLVGGDLDSRGGLDVRPAGDSAGPLVTVGGAWYVSRDDRPASVVAGAAVAGEVRGTNLDAAEVVQGPSPVDVAAVVAEVRQRSTEIAALPADGAVQLTPEALVLVGTHPAGTVFRVAAADLVAAPEVRIDVPAGSTAIVDVTGDTAQLGAAPLVVLGSPPAPAGEAEVPTAGEEPAPFGAERLVWNLSAATSVVVGPSAWLGTVIAPGAAVALGTDAVAPSSLHGALVAASLDSRHGAATVHVPFTGCLPGTAPTPEAPPAEPATSAATPAPTTPAPASETTTTVGPPTTTSPDTLPPASTEADPSAAPATVANQAITSSTTRAPSRTTTTTTTTTTTPSTVAADQTDEDDCNIFDVDCEDEDECLEDDDCYDFECVDDEDCDDYYDDYYDDYTDEDYDDELDCLDDDPDCEETLSAFDGALADSGGDPRRLLGTALVGLSAGGVLLLASRRRTERDARSGPRPA